MKEKSVLFPCDREFFALAEYIEFGGSDISGFCVLEDSNVIVDEAENIPIFDIADIDFGLFDNIILIDEAYRLHTFIEDGIRHGKKVVVAADIEKIKNEKFNDISEEQTIDVPVVFVAGITQYTEKFAVQLAIRKRLLEHGYKVSQIGSKQYSGLFGFHSFPSFMDEPMDNTERILLFRKYIKYIEQEEQPNIIVIGIPGGIMSVNRKHHFDFGLTAYMISHAVEPDYVIMNMLYNQNYTQEQLDEINQTCIHKFNWEIDSFHLSNSLLDPASLKSEILKFIKIGNKKYLNNVEELYDLMSPVDMDRMYKNMIDKLSSYNVNQIF